MKNSVFRLVPDSPERGVTLVELLVCMAVVAVVTFLGFLSWVRATSLETNLLAEARARTTLCQHLERLERTISLARSVHWETNGVPIGSPGELDPFAGYDICLEYPLEADGVSFETNRISHVSSVRLHCDPHRVFATASNQVGQVPSSRRFTMFSDSGFATDPQAVRLTRLSVTNVFEDPTLLEIAVDAEFRVRLRTEPDEEWKPLHAARYVRFWNVK